MIDSSICLLWEGDHDNEAISGTIDHPKADSARARRLQVLMAEARAAGMPWLAVAQIFVDWIELVIRQLSQTESTNMLQYELASARALIAGELPETEQPRSRDGEKSTRLASTLHAVIEPLAYRLQFDVTDDGQSPHAIDAWVWSLEALAAIDEVAGPLVIDRCAELAYKRLFPQLAMETRSSAGQKAIAGASSDQHISQVRMRSNARARTKGARGKRGARA